MSEKLVRLHVNLNPETAEALKAFAAEKGITLTEAIRRSVALMDYLNTAQRDGHKIDIIDPEEPKNRRGLLII